MKKSVLILALSLAFAAPALGQSVVNCKVTSASPTYNDNTAAPLSCDTAGNLRASTGGGTGALAQQVQGNSASGAADVGNPVKIGGVFNTTLPTFTNGQRGDVQIDVNGNIRALNTTILTAGVDAFTNTALGFAKSSSTTGNTLAVVGAYVFNGTAWDREFTCPNSAVINVAAGATTQLVALSGSTVIRVCSFTLTTNITGTAQFLYGTGSNCATSPVNLTGAMVVDTADISNSAGNGSLFRGAAGNALCLAAVTGTITGFVSYAQY